MLIVVSETLLFQVVQPVVHHPIARNVLLDVMLRRPVGDPLLPFPTAVALSI